MSTIAMRWAERQALSGSATLGSLINALAKRADKQGRAWISQATIAVEMHVSERHVRRWLPIAERLGLIRREARSRGRGRGRDTDMIVLPLGHVLRITREAIKAARESLKTARSAIKRLARPPRVTTGHIGPGTIRGPSQEGILGASSSITEIVRERRSSPPRWRAALSATASWLWGCPA